MTHHGAFPPKRGGRVMLFDLDHGSFREFAPLGDEPSSQFSFDLSDQQKYAAPGVPGARARMGRGPVPGPSNAKAAEPKRPDPVPVGIDPWQIAYDWPERWRDYLHTNFRNPQVVAQVFVVSEPAARKWWDGLGSCRADKVAIAVALHPQIALEMLYGIAAE